MTTRYTKDHEYIRVEGDTGIVGITDYAQSQLGDVVFVELPSVGKTVVEGRRGGGRREREGGERGLCAGLRRGGRGQQRSRRRARHGQRGSGRPRLVHEDRLTDPSELDGLMTEEQYQEFVKSIS